MTAIKALIFRAAGINCDKETAYALELAGAEAELMHVNRVIESPGVLDEYKIIVFPGGFSYGDDVAAGKVLANQVVHHLSGAIAKCIDDGALVLGICNGFQVLVKAGLLPAVDKQYNAVGSEQNVTITDNDNGKFEDRWTYLKPASSRCVFLDSERIIYLPIAHGEGKVAASTPEILTRLGEDDHIALRYVDSHGNPGGFPVNPNGSADDIAALTDTTGRVLGMMPHPERYITRTQHPRWTRTDLPDEGDGMSIFRNAVNYLKNA